MLLLDSLFGEALLGLLDLLSLNRNIGLRLFMSWLSRSIALLSLSSFIVIDLNLDLPKLCKVVTPDPWT